MALLTPQFQDNVIEQPDLAIILAIPPSCMMLRDFALPHSQNEEACGTAFMYLLYAILY